ncbi:MAG: 4-amino-4-deoxychorismate lyase [Hyphococcus sp.]|nr:MAG: 4-amino-4-deoxychorismate lyase [Marinicaulis sp.]
MTFWLNGEWRDDEVAINIRDRGVLLGDGLFETVRVEKGHAAFLNMHLDRLRNSLAALKIPQVTPEDMPSLINELACRNECIDQSASMRLTITRGISERGLVFSREQQPTVVMTMAPIASPSDAPLTLMVSAYRRGISSIMARHKTLGYLDNIMAREEAANVKADDAIMLNGAGRAACASAANIFVITPEGKVLTPPLDEGALPGIVRQLLLKQAKHYGIQILETPIERDMLTGNVLFLSNSLIGLRRAFLDESNHSTPAMENIFTQLQTCYQDAFVKSLGQEAGLL